MPRGSQQEINMDYIQASAPSKRNAQQTQDARRSGTELSRGHIKTTSQHNQTL